MEPGAEDKCLLFLQKALSLCPSDPEAWLTLASVRLSQSSPLEALACLSRAWAPWRSLAPGSLALPPSATRLAVARLMAELGLGRQALEVLGGVRDEDDEDVEAAYLEGWIWYLRGSGELPAIFSGDEAEMEGLRLPPPAEGEEVEPEPTKVECWEEARESLTVCVLVRVHCCSPASTSSLIVADLCSQSVYGDPSSIKLSSTRRQRSSSTRPSCSRRSTRPASGRPRASSTRRISRAPSARTRSTGRTTMMTRTWRIDDDPAF
jgi:hypothetical protein